MNGLNSIGCVCLAAALVILGHSGHAQDWPNRPVKVVVPFAAAGTTDRLGRLAAEELSKTFKQQFYVENRPGGGGVIGAVQVARADPDGYTLMIGNVSTNAITPIIYAKKMNTDYEKSVVAVTNLVDVPAFLLVGTANDFPVKSVPELIAYARQSPGKVRYGTVGIGSYPHYDMAYFAKRAGNLDLVGLPNKNGAAGVIQDMLRGDVQTAFLNVASTAGQVQAGAFRPLAVVNRTRLKEYPDIPTMTELGYGDVGTIAWNGLFAPAAIPRPVLQTLFTAVAKALNSPDAVEKLSKQNFNVVPNKSLDDAKAWLDAEMKHWQTITSAVTIDVTQ
jgi:tripartite-type tricarboxylate transporter receptor subunit TctC